MMCSVGAYAIVYIKALRCADFWPKRISVAQKQCTLSLHEKPCKIAKLQYILEVLSHYWLNLFCFEENIKISVIFDKI